MQRLNKEYKLDFNDSIKTIYGSVNRLNPQVVYVNGKTWITPSFDGDYKPIIEMIFSQFKREVRGNVINSPFFNYNCICDFDINVENLTKDKSSYMSFDVFVLQKNQTLDLKSIQPHITQIFKKIINKLKENFEDNSFVLTKSKQN